MLWDSCSKLASLSLAKLPRLQNVQVYIQSLMSPAFRNDETDIFMDESLAPTHRKSRYMRVSDSLPMQVVFHSKSFVLLRKLSNGARHYVRTMVCSFLASTS